MSAEGCAVAASDNHQNAVAHSSSLSSPSAAAAADAAGAGTDTDPSALAETTSSAKKRKYSEYMRDVETRFQCLTEKVLPSSPYLTTSSISIDNVHYSLANNNWCVGNGCVFSRREENLQYMTFLSYQDWDTSLVAVGGWSDANGNVMKDDEATPTTTTDSGGANPGGSVTVPKTKKKMTWSAYKEKKTIGNKETPLREEARIDEQRPVMKQEETDDEFGNDTGDGNDNAAQPIEQPIKQESPNLTSNRDYKEDIEPHHDFSAEESAQGPTKQPTAQPTEDLADKSSHESETLPLNDSNHLKQATPTSPQLKTEKPIYPEISSPEISGYVSPMSNVPSTTHPPPTMSTDIKDLPPLLSPTLPSPLIRNYPHAKEIFGFQKDISSQTSSPDVALPRQSPLVKKRKLDDSKERDERITTVVRKLMPTNDANDTETASNAIGAHPRSTPINSVERGDKNKAHLKSAVSETTNSPKSDSARRRARLIVRLKYGRAKTRIVHRILNGSAAHGAMKTIARTTPRSASPSVAKKKPSTQDDESSRSRSKGSRGALSSKTPSVADSHQQSRSSDSKPSIRTNEARKRPAASSRSQTDSSSSHRTNKSGVETASHVSDDGHHSWKQESMKYWQLARELRHDWRGCPDDAFAVVLGIESLLASTLYCAIQEKLDTSKGRAVTSDSWVNNFLPIWRDIKSKTVRYPPLQGLRLLLGAIINALIHERDLEGVINEVDKGGSHALSVGGGSDSESHTDGPDLKRSKKAAKRISDSLDTYRRARQFWLKGSQLLSDTVIKDEFPDNWRKYQSVPRDHTRELQEPGTYLWQDIAPLTFLSTPIEAVRFAYAFLTDWAGKYHPKWKGQLDRI